MNNISDITILVAVLALALWPAIIVYLSWRREKKIISCLKNETPATKTPKLSTEELIVSTLKKMGCNPEKNEEGNIGFMYQGDDFYLSFQEDVPFVMIWYPWWGTVGNHQCRQSCVAIPEGGYKRCEHKFIYHYRIHGRK